MFYACQGCQQCHVRQLSTTSDSLCVKDFIRTCIPVKARLENLLMHFAALILASWVGVAQTAFVESAPPPFLKSLPEGGCVAEGQSCGMLEENILSIFPNIPTMDQCNLLCRDTPNCTFATHFGSESFPFSSSCVLFTACDVLHECSGCTTLDKSCTTAQ